MGNVIDSFRIDGKVVIITGGAGLLGSRHAEAIAEAGGLPVLWDINGKAVSGQAKRLMDEYSSPALGMKVDITSKDEIKEALKEVTDSFNRVDVLINNAANDPKIKPGKGTNLSRYENLPLKVWNDDIAVGLTGAFLCAQVVGTLMAESAGGVIVNVASDLGVIAPDQRIYSLPGVPDDEQPVKSVTYSVVKHGLIGLTKYLATYWADKKVRVNSISPGGVHAGQSEDFVRRLSSLIPMGRMAGKDEYKAAIVFLCSDASSYMTGSNLIIDGGRSVW